MNKKNVSRLPDVAPLVALKAQRSNNKLCERKGSWHFTPARTANRLQTAGTGDLRSCDARSADHFSNLVCCVDLPKLTPVTRDHVRTQKPKKRECVLHARVIRSTYGTSSRRNRLGVTGFCFCFALSRASAQQCCFAVDACCVVLCVVSNVYWNGAG